MLNNNLLTNWKDIFGTASTQMIQDFVSFLPRLFASLFIFIIGLLIANWSRSLTLKSFGLFEFSFLTKNKKIKKFLTKAEVTQKIEEIIASLVKWLVLLVFFIASLNVLGLTTISNLLYQIIAYLPNILSAVVVLALGVLLAGFMESLVKGALASIDLKTSRLMGKITSYVTITVAILIAISELNIAQNFINIIFIGFVSTLSLGIGLAIGLGGKDLVSQILNDWYQSFKQDVK